jgi:uncharacterized protein
VVWPWAPRSDLVVGSEGSMRRSPSPSLFALGVAAAVVVAVAGCSGGYAARTADFREAVARHDLGRARAEIDALVAEAAAEESALEAEYPLLLLERSTVALAELDYVLTVNDLNEADGLLEVLDLSPANAEQVGQYLWSDDSGLYRAPAYEKLMVNLVKLAAYLALGDLSGARVEARRLDVLVSYYDSTDLADHPVLATAYHLAGLAMELSGETDRAMRFYLDAWRREPRPLLGEAIARLAPESSLRGRSEVREARELLGLGEGERLERPEQEAIVLLFSGLAPRREAERFPLGLVWGWVTDGGLRLGPAYKEPWERIRAEQLLTWINFPVLVPQRPAHTLIEVASAHGVALAEELADFEGFALAQWEQERPTLALAALTRAIVRVLARETVQAVGDAATDSDEGRAAFYVASLLLQAGMQAADVPDTRTWSTMAGHLLLARVPAAAGPQTLEVTASGPAGSWTGQLDIEIPAGGRRVIALRVLP